jgi:DNA-binding NarL/FixJ family response regulator
MTARELQVLRLVAAGKTNHAIVSSRAAATAHAYRHRLL